MTIKKEKLSNFEFFFFIIIQMVYGENFYFKNYYKIKLKLCESVEFLRNFIINFA